MHRGYLASAIMCLPLADIALTHTATCKLGGRKRTVQCVGCSLEDVIRRLLSGSGHPMSDDIQMVRVFIVSQLRLS